MLREKSFCRKRVGGTHFTLSYTSINQKNIFQNVSVKLIMTRNDDSVCLLTADENPVTTVLENITINARRVNL